MDRERQELKNRYSTLSEEVLFSEKGIKGLYGAAKRWIEEGKKQGDTNKLENAYRFLSDAKEIQGKYVGKVIVPKEELTNLQKAALSEAYKILQEKEKNSNFISRYFISRKRGKIREQLKELGERK